MRSPLPSSVVIVCPHCDTRYQVPPETLGDAGRKVACANCGKAWLAERIMPVAPSDEDQLDRSFALEERAALERVPASVRQLVPEGEVPPPDVLRSIAEIQAALAPRSEPLAEPEPATKPKAKKDKNPLLAKRQKVAHKSLRAAQLQRTVRIASFSLLLAVIAGGAIFRTEIVRAVPDMAGLYELVGLKVNTVGLDFSDVSTLISHRGDASVISVSATIYGVEQRRVIVPPVVVTLLDPDDRPIYQWSVAPRASDLEPGEVIGLSTELASPPAGATRVRLSFADGPAGSPAPLQ